MIPILLKLYMITLFFIALQQGFPTRGGMRPARQFCAAHEVKYFHYVCSINEIIKPEYTISQSFGSINALLLLV